MAYPSLGSPDAYDYRVQSGSKLPWFLLVLVLGGVGYGGYLGWKERSRLMDRGQRGDRRRGQGGGAAEAGRGEAGGAGGGEERGGGRP
jgi:hypothetical protein